MPLTRIFINSAQHHYYAYSHNLVKWLTGKDKVLYLVGYKGTPLHDLATSFAREHNADAVCIEQYTLATNFDLLAKELHKNVIVYGAKLFEDYHELNKDSSVVIVQGHLLDCLDHLYDNLAIYFFRKNKLLEYLDSIID